MTSLERSSTTVHGIPALRLTGPSLAVTVTTGMGPRIVGLAGPDGRNLLAELPAATIDLPGLPTYRMLGGHRLWHTPEVPASTYRPDEGPVAVTDLPDGVDLVGTDDPDQGLRKRLRVTFGADGSLGVEHGLRNTGAAAVTTAAWAITQVPPRGEAWVPFATGELDGPYLPNRAVVLWPYSSLADPRLTVADDLAIVRGVAGSEGRVKVGTGRDPGWIAWRDGGSVLVIEAALEPGAYGDRGAGTQCYSCGDFVELETVGPITTLAPGEELVHRQVWRVRTVDPTASREVVLAELGLAGAG